jgi:hypothetical protein
MPSVRDLAKRVLPTGAADWYRRRRELRRFMRALGSEVYARQVKMDVEELEGKALSTRPEVTERLFKDLMARTDVVLQELDRKVEALRARQGDEIRSLREEVAAVREELASLRSSLQGTHPPD